MQRPPHTGFEELLRGIDIVVRVDAKIAAPALSHARLRRQMKDVGHAGQQTREVRILDSRLDKAKALATLIDGEVRFLQGTRVVIGEAVDAR